MKCIGLCAMYHQCPCPDKIERHKPGTVADVPGQPQPRKPLEPGRQLREALAALREQR